LDLGVDTHLAAGVVLGHKQNSTDPREVTMAYRLETRVLPSGRVVSDYVFYGEPITGYGDTLADMCPSLNRDPAEDVLAGALIGAAIGAAIGNFIDSYRAARKARKS
jgi:hypothetical protein